MLLPNALLRVKLSADNHDLSVTTGENPGLSDFIDTPLMPDSYLKGKWVGIR